VLWIVAGFGWRMQTPAFQSVHYRLMGWFLHHVVGSAKKNFQISIVPQSDPIERDDRERRPLLVFSRHAGPADSLLLVESLMNNAELHPRIVLKDALQFDPVVDVVLNRLPNRFIRSGGQDAVKAIAELAATMGEGEALVLFPEGANYTSRRRTRAIESLEAHGRPDLAEQARKLDNVLPPRSTGPLTAIRSAPNADVTFVGHVGLERMMTARDIWREMPIDSLVITRLWHVTAEQLPAEAEREQWLYDHWKLLDEWISATAADQQ
jgi:1-acyl-sn-glycerol-3-phosphate acyltransferase